MRKLFLILLLLLPAVGFCQSYKAVHISVAEGLSQSSVYDIVQDPKGFTWIATQDGLNRYDGINFQVYRDEPFDTNSISSNSTSALLCDSKGRLWAGTANHGLNLFSPSRQGFRHFQADGLQGSLASNLITALHEDADGNIWVGTANGLHRLKEINRDGTTYIEFEKIPLTTVVEDTVPDKFITVIASGANHDLWVGTYMGLFKFTTSGSIIKQSEWYSKKNNKLADTYVFSITLDKKGRVWAGHKYGIDVIDIVTGKRVTFSQESELQEGMTGNITSTLFTASNGDIWIGYNDRGVQVVRAISLSAYGKLKFERVEVNAPLNALENGKAISFYEDKITRGIIWAGFNAGGFVRLIPVTKRFSTNRLSTSPLPSPFVTGVIKDHLQQVWIGTSAGLLLYNRENKTYRSFIPSEYSKTPGRDEYINGLAAGGDGSIYFGAKNELFNITQNNGKFKVKSIPVPDEVEGNSMRTIVRDELGRIFVILRYSIYEYDPLLESYSPVIKITDQKKLLDRGFYLSTFYKDVNGNYWVGTSSGLELYPKHAGSDRLDTREGVTFHHLPQDTNSLRNQNILCIGQDRNGNIWLGTMNGLTRVVNDKGTRRFLNYSSRNGLKNNVIYAIIPDSRTGNLWLSTNNGLTEFDTKGYAVVTYDVHDGLQSNEFNSYAAFRAPDGEMFFGGIEGYTSFYPEHIRRDNSPPFVSITGIVLDENRYLNLADYQESKTINLRYKDNSFTVTFAGLHYVDPQKNQYAYQLEGFQTGWTYSGNTNKVNFTQLAPGKYIFRVKAANSDGVYNTSGDMFIINIEPPFHMTIWFYLIIAVCITGILWGLHKYRLSMKLAQVKEVEQLRRVTAADFHDELGHKLTIISWFAEILKKKIGPEQADLRPHLDRIIEASGTLYHTMKDMLWAMDPDKDSVYDLYSQIREFGLELFDNTGILFDAEEISAELKARIISPAHKRHVLLIFKEVMNNSLKHAHSTNTHLDLVKDDNHIKFRFRDNGKGFKMNGHNVGHGLNNVKRRAHLIHAEMNIHSEGDGTVAELDLPIDRLN